MSNEFELDFRMPNNEKPLFVCWQCVIAENIEPSKFGEFWFNPVTGTKNKGLAYYPSNLRKINKAPQNHLYGSLL